MTLYKAVQESDGAAEENSVTVSIDIPPPIAILQEAFEFHEPSGEFLLVPKVMHMLEMLARLPAGEWQKSDESEEHWWNWDMEDVAGRPMWWVQPYEFKVSCAIIFQLFGSLTT